MRAVGPVVAEHASLCGHLDALGHPVAQPSVDPADDDAVAGLQSGLFTLDALGLSRAGS